MLGQYRRLILVKKYLFISLLLSIFPLIVTAFIYDRYTASLLDNILSERLNSDMEAVADNISDFIKLQSRRIINLVDMPEVEEVFKINKGDELSDKLLDFIYLEVGSRDIYSVHFYDANNGFITSVPNQEVSYLSQHVSLIENVTATGIVGPILPTLSRPGWLGVKRDVLRGSEKLGSVLLKIRLASITEKASKLYRKDFYEPRIKVGEASYLSILGVFSSTPSSFQLTSSKKIIPGWELFLIKNEKNLSEPRVKIRYLLLVVIALACASIIAVFLNMSDRLVQLITPLTEAAKSIAKGDFSIHVPEQGTGELKELSSAFNQMSGQLEFMIDSRVDAERRGHLGSLAAGLAHEIRNPLTTLRTSIHALHRSEPEQEKKVIFEIVSEEILRIDAMVERFLAYARPHEPHIEAIEMKDFLEDFEALMSGTLSEANIQLGFLGDRSLTVKADRAQLRQVFMNLVLNAMQAMINGGHLSIGLQRAENSAIITFSDTGLGMDAETLAKIQQPFFTTRSKGTGLGLAICTQLLKENNASMSIESHLDQGTRIIIELPLMSRIVVKADDE